MLGRFTTRKFRTAADHAAGRSFEELVSYNEFTDMGLAWFWQTAFDPGPDNLKSARIVVGDGTKEFDRYDDKLAGDNRSAQPLDEGFPDYEIIVEDGQPDVCRGIFQATFGESEAVFEWEERGVLTSGGVLIDRSVGSQGFKVMGAVWVVVAELDLTR